MARMFALLLTALAAVSVAGATGATCSSLMQVRSKTTKGLQDHVGAPPLDENENKFLVDLFQSYGKQATNYSGAQTFAGLSSRALLDEQGMLSFENNVKSVAIDVGAANNPLIFDMEQDADQVVLAFEPVFADQLAIDLEKRQEEVAARGGCTTRWEAYCANARLMVFPAAVSPEVGYVKFHLSDNPYCGSLNEVANDLDPELVNHPDPEIRDVMKSCWGSLKGEDRVKEVPSVSLASILRRIPKDIRVKYLKIDAQGHDYKVSMSAAEQMSRIEYVRFEMQVDPLPGRKMVADVPSYAEVASKMKELGFMHEGSHACYFDGNAPPFSKAIMEQECVFCRELPCKEHAAEPLGENPLKVLGLTDPNH